MTSDVCCVQSWDFNTLKCPNGFWWQIWTMYGLKHEQVNLTHMLLRATCPWRIWCGMSFFIGFCVVCMFCFFSSLEMESIVTWVLRHIYCVTSFLASVVGGSDLGYYINVHWGNSKWLERWSWHIKIQGLDLPCCKFWPWTLTWPWQTSSRQWEAVHNYLPMRVGFLWMAYPTALPGHSTLEHPLRYAVHRKPIDTNTYRQPITTHHSPWSSKGNDSCPLWIFISADTLITYWGKPQETHPPAFPVTCWLQQTHL
jgi:hypothetical protein